MKRVNIEAKVVILITTLSWQNQSSSDTAGWMEITGQDDKKGWWLGTTVESYMGWGVNLLIVKQTKKWLWANRTRLTVPFTQNKWEGPYCMTQEGTRWMMWCFFIFFLWLYSMSQSSVSSCAELTFPTTSTVPQFMYDHVEKVSVHVC